MIVITTNRDTLFLSLYIQYSSLLFRWYKLNLFIIISLYFEYISISIHLNRYYVVYRIKKLKFLDSSAVTEAERKEANRVGPYMITAKPTQTQQPVTPVRPLYLLPLTTTLSSYYYYYYYHHCYSSFSSSSSSSNYSFDKILFPSC